MSHSQKIELIEKIEKLQRGNLENIEIRDQLTRALSVNEQQLNMLKSHIMLTIENNLSMIFKLEMQDIEKRYEVVDLTISNLTLTQENTIKANTLTDYETKIRELTTKLTDLRIQLKDKDLLIQSMDTQIKKMTIEKKHSNKVVHADQKENYFSTPKAEAKFRENSKSNTSKPMTYSTKFNVVGSSREKSSSPTIDRTSKSPNQRILFKSSKDQTKSSEKNIEINKNSSGTSGTIPSARRETVHLEKTESISTSHFDKTTSSFSDALAARYSESNIMKSQKETKIATIELKNPRGSNENEKLKTPSVNSRYGTKKSNEIPYEDYGDKLKPKVKLSPFESPEISTYDLLHSIESMRINSKDHSTTHSSNYISTVETYVAPSQENKTNAEFNPLDSKVIGSLHHSPPNIRVPSNQFTQEVSSSAKKFSRGNKDSEMKDDEGDLCLLESVSGFSQFKKPQELPLKDMTNIHSPSKISKPSLHESQNSIVKFGQESMGEFSAKGNHQIRHILPRSSHRPDDIMDSESKHQNPLESEPGSPVIIKRSKTILADIGSTNFQKKTYLSDEL